MEYGIERKQNDTRLFVTVDIENFVQN